MTGYGKTESQLRDKKIVCEIRSLNSKSLEMSMRLSPLFSPHELDLRSHIAKRVERGKIDILFAEAQADTALAAEPAPLNWTAAKRYAAQYEEQFGEPVPPEVMASILRLPEVVRLKEEVSELSDSEWTAVQEMVERTLDAFVAFRTQEGAALQDMFSAKLDEMTSLLAQVEPFEKSRVAKIRARLEQNLALLSEQTRTQVDQNRLEQEMIYYLEKLDITEEKVRLTNHIRYFRETMACEGSGVGKKLGFIAQEMGREINTLGSKSNQSEMQILVVKMKDLLEQIKEQVLNVL